MSVFFDDVSIFWLLLTIFKKNCFFLAFCLFNDLCCLYQKLEPIEFTTYFSLHLQTYMALDYKGCSRQNFALIL